VPIFVPPPGGFSSRKIDLIIGSGAWGQAVLEITAFFDHAKLVALPQRGLSAR
jgi:hypothetical protein